MTTDATPLPPAPPLTADAAPNFADAFDYQSLDPRVVRLWQISDLIGWGVFLVAGLVGGVILAMKVESGWVWATAGLAAMVVLAAWSILYYHPRNYRAWGYRLDRRVMLVKYGVWWRTIKLLPLPRLQHVDVKRGPLQRHLGLATLVLHTAGTQSASIEVPGLDADEAVRLRDRLVAAGGDDGV
jgi:hypothetical protein